MLSDSDSPRITDQRAEPQHGGTQPVLAVAHVGHRFDEGVTLDETRRRLGMKARSTFYRKLDTLKARGLIEMPRLMHGRVFSAASIERVVHGESVRADRRRR